MQAPAFAARCMKKSPAHTRHSLFASATVAPRSTAARAGFKPAAPLTAAMTQSAGRAATWIGDRGKPYAEFLRQFCQPLHIGMGGQGLDPIAVTRGSQQIHRAVADR